MAERAASSPSGWLRGLRLRRSRLMPRGPVDLVLQFVILAAAYTAWRYARGAVHGDTAAAMGGAVAHAHDLISAERSMGLLFEPSVQSWAIDWGWPAEIARWGYANLHFKVSCLALLVIYFWRPASFPFVRNMAIAAMAISVVAYALYPTAPPRFIDELGLDTSASVTGNDPIQLSGGGPLYNPFAAVPSMHIGFALIFAGSLALLVRSRAAKLALLAYPLLMTYIVVASGNHFWLDGVFGALTAALAAGVAYALGRANPVWAFRRRTEEAELPGLAEPEPEAATA